VNIDYERLSEKEKTAMDKMVEEAERKAIKWFNSRGYSEADMLEADAEFEKFLLVEKLRYNQITALYAPVSRKLFMLGYFHGRNK